MCEEDIIPAWSWAKRASANCLNSVESWVGYVGVSNDICVMFERRTLQVVIVRDERKYQWEEKGSE